MSIMRTQCNYVCEGFFVNYKGPNSVPHYFYFKTNRVTSGRCLGCKGLPRLWPDFSANEVDGSRQVTSTPHPV